MPDNFQPVSSDHLLQIILRELEEKESVFGIPRDLFFIRKVDSPFRVSQFGHSIETPVGVAAGPHTQMAQNIIGAWLMGSRYIELKTIQTLDNLNISKPCIDIPDEGYNCEWSQELTIKESFNEYLNAWIIIHILNHKLGGPADIETIFNMSAGYNLEGIMKENMQWFFGKMRDCSNEIEEKTRELKNIYPELDTLSIPSRISDNITLSTMHGCPAGEIELIAKYLIGKQNLHTYIKLNPTLLGPDDLRDILNKKLRFRTSVPLSAFEHDLKYRDAISIIKSLQSIARTKDLHFGLKLTNTLESKNTRDHFKKDVEMMYMSGRALHPLAIELAKRLQLDFRGELEMSFSAGSDAFNISDILACGFKTITVCTDLLKPGGYMRLHQYFENILDRFRDTGSKSIEEFIVRSSSKSNLTEAALSNLVEYSEKVLKDGKYKREYIRTPDIKTNQILATFDCIAAPCVYTCATNQDIPGYLRSSASGNFAGAFRIILLTNPFPAVTGMVCDHLCQTKCTRINYDDPLLIREVKRFISGQKEVRLKPVAPNKNKVAIIGAGPSGLSCAYYLALAGFDVTVFEANSKAGGMVSFAIPGFRLTDEAFERDLKRIKDTGVKILYDKKIDHDMFISFKSEFDFVYLATGAWLSVKPDIEGIDTAGVLDPLEFLFRAKQGKATGSGEKVVIIGGGNTAMDAARTAYRLTGEKGKVTVLYRRTLNEMPADQNEIKAVLEEGISVIELAAPVKIVSKNGKVDSIICNKFELREPDSSGRPRPVAIPGSEFSIRCDTVIPATGQRPDIKFIPDNELPSPGTGYGTKTKNVLIGGDALRGASTAINAIGDGKRAAQEIIVLSGYGIPSDADPDYKNYSKKELIIKRSKRIYAPPLNELSLDMRRNFNLVSSELSREIIVKESDRCLSCDLICNICTTVCPNFANYSYDVDPVKYDLSKIILRNNGSAEMVNDIVFEVRQRYQILNIINFCNDCGNCNTFCPTGSAPYMIKPGICLTQSSFEKENKVYFLAGDRNHKSLLFKENGEIMSLTENGTGYIFETNQLTAHIIKRDFHISSFKLKTSSAKEIRFIAAAEMSVIIKGAYNLIFK